jgi:hypothetical protein
MIKNYLLHLRPKSFVPSFMFALTGYAINPNKGALAPIPLELSMLFLIYSVLLFGGTCAINSHYDTDTGPLNFLENPPPKPKYLGLFGMLVMITGILLSLVAGEWVFVMAVFSFFLSLLYSMKIPGLKWRGKEVGIVDNVINALGCGLVGVVMGATFGNGSPNIEILLLGIAFTITAAGSYPATQIFQLKAGETYAEARNFTTLLGPTRALKIGAFLLLLGLSIVDLTQIMFFDFRMQYVALVLFFGFNVSFILAVMQMWRWARSSFDNTKIRYKNLVITLLGARLLWIVAQWMIG